MSRNLAVPLMLAFTVAEAVAAPFPLHVPDLVPSPKLYGVTVGTSAEGFLIVGTAWDAPTGSRAVLGLDRHGQPIHVTPRDSGLPHSALTIGSPVRVGGRWLVPALGPSDARGLWVAQIRDDGTSGGPTVAFPWDHYSGPLLAAWNGRRVLFATSHESFDGVAIASVSPDLSVVSAQSQLEGSSPRTLVATPHGFALIRPQHDHIRIDLLDDDGRAHDAPERLPIAQMVLSVDAASDADGTVVAWIEYPGTVRAARLGSSLSGSVIVHSIPGAGRGWPGPFLSVSPLHIEAATDGFILFWQETIITDARENNISVLRAQRINRSGVPFGAPESHSLPLDARLENVGTTSAGAFAVFERSPQRASTSLWTLRLGEHKLNPATLGFPDSQIIAVMTAVEDRAVVLWTEKSAVDGRMMAGAWNARGARVSSRSLFATDRVRSSTADHGNNTILIVTAEDEWPDGTIVGRFVDPVTFASGEPFEIARGTNDDSPFGPRVAWDGTRFVVLWQHQSRLEGAAITRDGVEYLGSLLQPLPEVLRRGFPRRYPGALAATSDGFVFVGVVTDSGWCGDFGSCTRSFEFEEIVRFDRDGKILDRWLREVPQWSGSSAVATDGRDYLIVSRGADGVTARALSGTRGEFGPERSLWRSPAATVPQVTWDGRNGYFVSWSALLPAGAGRGFVMQVGPDGVPAGPLRETAAGEWPRVARVGDDALIAAALRVPQDRFAMLLRGEMMSETRQVEVPPLPAPVATAANVSAWSLELAWLTAEGAEAYYVQTLDPGGVWNTVRVLPANVTAVRIEFDLPIYGARVIAVTATGASDPLEFRLPHDDTRRRRSVRR